MEQRLNQVGWPCRALGPGMSGAANWQAAIVASATAVAATAATTTPIPLCTTAGWAYVAYE